MAGSLRTRIETSAALAVPDASMQHILRALRGAQDERGRRDLFLFTGQGRDGHVKPHHVVNLMIAAATGTPKDAVANAVFFGDLVGGNATVTYTVEMPPNALSLAVPDTKFSTQTTRPSGSGSIAKICEGHTFLAVGGELLRAMALQPEGQEDQAFGGTTFDLWFSLLPEDDRYAMIGFRDHDGGVHRIEFRPAQASLVGAATAAGALGGNDLFRGVKWPALVALAAIVRDSLAHENPELLTPETVPVDAVSDAGNASGEISATNTKTEGAAQLGGTTAPSAQPEPSLGDPPPSGSAHGGGYAPSACGGTAEASGDPRGTINPKEPTHEHQQSVDDRHGRATRLFGGGGKPPGMARVAGCAA